MAATERLTMTMRELDRFTVIQNVADGRLVLWPAAETRAEWSGVRSALEAEQQPTGGPDR